MEPYISLNDIYPSNIKNFFVKLCLVSKRNAEKDEIPGTATKSILRTQVQQLEHELKEAKKEKYSALEENKNRIEELTVQLLSVKTSINRLLQEKKQKEERKRYLEDKIRKTVN